MPLACLRACGVLPLLVGLLHAPWSLAQTSPPRAASPSSGDAVVKRLDPSDFRTRVEARVRTQEFQSGLVRSQLLPRLDYAVSKKFSLRLETPLTYADPNRPGRSDEAGFGDLLVRLSYRAWRSKDFAVVTALETTFDTASDPILGLGTNVVSPVVFASIDVPALKSTFFPGFQHYFSVGGGANSPNIQYTQFRTVLFTRWPNRYYTVLDGQYFVDYELDNRFGFLLEVEGGRLLSKHVGVWVRPGVGLAGDNVRGVYNWQIEAGIRYLFD
jgi:hypothetical protein